MSNEENCSADICEITRRTKVGFENIIPAIHQKKVNHQNLVQAKDYMRDLSHLLHVDLIHHIKMY